MQEIEGVVTLQSFGTSEVVTINGMPVSKFFHKQDGKKVSFSLQIAMTNTLTFKGDADIFYFEGKQKFNAGIKYVNDFFIDDIDIIELLLTHQNELVKITMKSVSEVSTKNMSQ